MNLNCDCLNYLLLLSVNENEILFFLNIKQFWSFSISNLIKSSISLVRPRTNVLGANPFQSDVEQKISLVLYILGSFLFLYFVDQERKSFLVIDSKVWKGEYQKYHGITVSICSSQPAMKMSKLLSSISLNRRIVPMWNTILKMLEKRNGAYWEKS